MTVETLIAEARQELEQAKADIIQATERHRATQARLQQEALTADNDLAEVLRDAVTRRERAAGAIDKLGKLTPEGA